MKRFKLFLLVFFVSTTMFAQSFEGKGDTKLDVGYDLYGYGNGIKVNLDFGISDLFSIGAGGSYYLSNDVNDYFVYARGAIHFGELLDLDCSFDFYPGLEVGYLQGDDVGFTAFIGARYFFTDRIGVFVELGNNGSLGLSMNL